MIRALVVDDQGLVRAGVRVLLQTAPDIEVVGEAPDGHEAVRMAERLRPDVVLMDIRMPRVDGIEATRRILATSPSTNVLMLTTFADEEYVYDALSAGAVGFMLKDGEPDAMIDAVRRAVRGEPLLAAPVLARSSSGPGVPMTPTGPPGRPPIRTLPRWAGSRRANMMC